MDKKNNLRKRLLAERLGLIRSQSQVNSVKIVQKLIDVVDWQDVQKVSIYQAINNEVNPRVLLNFLEENYPDIEIQEAPNQLEDTKNIPEGENYDLVIVPLLGFDRQRNRLGYGGGYYDKFLIKNNCKQKIGLAYSFQEVEEIPTEAHDQKLDKIITNKEII